MIVQYSTAEQLIGTVMARTSATLIALGFGLGSTLQPPANGQAQQATSIPREFAGDWICQTFRPGYSVTPYHADISQPLTNKMTTPGSVAIVKMSLRSDGTYQTAGGSGRYAFDSTTKALTWLDGPHQGTITKTQLGKRDNGAPKMGFSLNQRYYGCFMPARR